MKTLLSNSIPQQLYRPEQVRENESKAAELAGVSMWQLMQRAGKAVFECLQNEFPAPLKVAVLCGSGNNGGDGYILASHALQSGYEVRLFASRAPSTEDAERAEQEWITAGGVSEALPDWQDSEPDVVIDALLGTGLEDNVRGEIKDCIETLNEARLAVIAVDLPSGLHGDTGRVLGCAVEARHTVTMVALKRGLFTGQAGDYVGNLEFADLGILREFRTLTNYSAWRLESGQLWQAFAPRPWNSHKGMFGHVLIIGGEQGMTGAVQLAGLAALRSGAGKVSVICAPGQQSMAAGVPELMLRGLNVDDPQAEQLMLQADVIAIGPGLGQNDWGRSWWHKVKDSEKPLVVDADALNLLAESPFQRDDWVLTPHPGEAARLLAASVSDNEENRWATAAALQEQYGGVVVLKGAGSIVHGHDFVAVNTSGNPGLASAGMGDVLTGIIGALLAPLYVQSANICQGPAELVAQAVLVHGAAADSAAQQQPRGLIASDVISTIRIWVNPQHA
ncbi:bifunctional ADP-dependent NAD(P)H-hydrate dehydratase/NAD(P)H-hydrate epimerase [Aliidiomarina minuta]|uniref:Bifunctional NAD(P)H-hydrate repair enzyme n=1 Tax=Aliidiomarina minuta TaxID=880057 RepID=A0A432WAX4_9GAMM|nr:NAD(P)H-hydrate dehydratase [Aliidiomarina minuta]RUO26738.1 bifunctional ADP-dependent NAD(P)H-hydrate dehydratase/NAD(P)H-hydrate epimerase [Aliidiomarina minuta]